MLNIIEVPVGFCTVVMCDVRERRADDAEIAAALYCDTGSTGAVHGGAVQARAESLAESCRRGGLALSEHLAKSDRHPRAAYIGGDAAARNAAEPERRGDQPRPRGRAPACWRGPEPCRRHVLAAIADDETPGGEVPPGNTQGKG
jgi:hypothetical protein